MMQYEVRNNSEIEAYKFRIYMNIDWPEDEDYDPVEDDITFFSTGNNFGWNTSYPNLSFQREDVQAEYESFIRDLDYLLGGELLESIAGLIPGEVYTFRMENITIMREPEELNKKSSIAVNQKTKRELKKFALTDGESYENIILRLIKEAKQ